MRIDRNLLRKETSFLCYKSKEQGSPPPFRRTWQEGNDTIMHWLSLGLNLLECAKSFKR